MKCNTQILEWKRLQFAAINCVIESFYFFWRVLMKFIDVFGCGSGVYKYEKPKINLKRYTITQALVGKTFWQLNNKHLAVMNGKLKWKSFSVFSPPANKTKTKRKSLLIYLMMGKQPWKIVTNDTSVFDWIIYLMKFFTLSYSHTLLNKYNIVYMYI